MKTSSIVRLHALVSIEPGDWINFKFQLEETKQIVQGEGDDVLTHACYRQSGTDQCLIVEAYRNEEVFLRHLALVQSVAQRHPVKITFHQIQLAGAYSKETIRLLKDISPDCEVLYFDDHLNN